VLSSAGKGPKADTAEQLECSIRARYHHANAELYVAHYIRGPVASSCVPQILTKLALLLFTGENWGRQEATTLFFGSKLLHLS
jgi:hypothetical protein